MLRDVTIWWAGILILVIGVPASSSLADDMKKPAPVVVPKFELAATLEGHTRLVRCVAFQPSSHVVVSGGSDRALRRWNGDTGKLLAENLLPEGG
jgi:WD40 repeat protein